MLEKLLAKRHIRNLDFSSVRSKIEETMGWDQKKAIEAEAGYKRFLYALAHKDRDDIISPPTPEIDEFWHQHILDTRKYREDCETVFGHYMDHTPGLDPETQRKADARRRELYERFDIDSVDLDAADSRGSDGGNGGDAHKMFDFGTGHSTHGHGSHSTGGHGCDSGSGHASDAGGHGCDTGGGDSGGGGDGGGGGGCGGAGCGGGGCGGG